MWEIFYNKFNGDYINNMWFKGNGRELEFVCEGFFINKWGGIWLFLEIFIMCEEIGKVLLEE